MLFITAAKPNLTWLVHQPLKISKFNFNVFKVKLLRQTTPQKKQNKKNSLDFFFSGRDFEAQIKKASCVQVGNLRLVSHKAQESWRPDHSRKRLREQNNLPSSHPPAQVIDFHG